jgi:hypothetical protein
MDQQQASTDSTEHQFNGPRLAMIATALVVSFGVLIWVCTALMNCKRRRPQPTSLPRAYLLPVYFQRGRSHTSTSAAPSRSTLVYPLYPAMPLPDYSEEDPLAHRQTRVSVPLQARTRSVVDGDDDGVHVFSSVQRGHYRRHHHIHPALRRDRIRESARESVETLPRYENPPSYKSDNGLRHST